MTILTPDQTVELVTFVGNLGKDIAPTLFKSGKQVFRSSLAISSRKDEKPQWLKVEAWDALGRRFAGTCIKGARVALTGVLKNETWTDSEGKIRETKVLKITWIDKIAKAPN
jgi:single-stranded DNA-binding protein